MGRRSTGSEVKHPACLHTGNDLFSELCAYLVLPESQPEVRQVLP